MKKLAISTGCLLASLTFFAQGPQTYKGEISIANAPLWAGHQIMEKQGESPKDCTTPLRKHGRQVHPVRSRHQDRLSLDDQKKSAAFAGAKVSVTGTLNPATKTNPRDQHQGRFLEHKRVVCSAKVINPSNPFEHLGG